MQSKVLILAACLLALGTQAQTLARPGWVGNNLTTDLWWRHAVMYRIDDATLPTESQLTSLQAFGIDAIVLSQNPPEQTPQPAAPQPIAKTTVGADGFATVDVYTGANVPKATTSVSLDDLLFECSRLHMRVIVPLELNAADPAQTLALARSWLYRGAAGFVVSGLDKFPHAAAVTPPAAPITLGTATTSRRATRPRPIVLSAPEPQLMSDLRKLLTQFPGDRILIGAASSNAAAMPSLQLQLTSLGPHPSADPLLPSRLSALSTVTAPRPLLVLEQQWNPGLKSETWGTQSVLSPVDAAILLATDQPAVIDSAQLPLELLAKTFPPLATVKPPEPVVAPAPEPPPPPPDVYGAFKEYVPKPSNKPSAAARRKAEEAAAEAATIQADTFPVQPMYTPITQTPAGFAAFERRMVQAHHANATLREATLHPLLADPSHAFAWVALRAGAPPVIVALNLSATRARLDLATGLHKLSVQRSTARTLLHTDATSDNEPTGTIPVGPMGVYVGELH